VASIFTVRVLIASKKPDGTLIPEGSIIEVSSEEIEELLESKTVELVRVTSFEDE